jgi:hypothetical protein
VVIHFGADLQRVPEGGGSNGENHELLHGELVAGVAAAVDDVEGWDGQHHLATGKVGYVAVEGHALGSSASLANCEGDGKDGVGAQPALVVGAVELYQRVVDGLLLHGIQPDDDGAEHGVHMVHRVQDAFAQVASLVSIAQFNGFVDASGGAAWHCGAEHAVLGGEVHLDGGVAAAVQDFARFD